MKKIWYCVLLLFAFLAFVPPAHAADNIGLLMRGVARTVFSAFEIPKQMLASSTTAFPLGLVGGAINGTMRTVAGTLVGATDIARGAAPYAKYLVFL